mmetsp:Transcript_63662/g.207762  ORF Transcript_63662/g.207762 Transcript_63662/m.207762 type:complete len:207 (-) Transcript_63662:68-688(-)
MGGLSGAVLDMHIFPTHVSREIPQAQHVRHRWLQRCRKYGLVEIPWDIEERTWNRQVLSGLAWSALTFSFAFWSCVAAFGSFPVATLPVMLGQRFARAFGGWSWLLAVVSFDLKENSEHLGMRGGAGSAPPHLARLRHGVLATAVLHLLVNAAKWFFDDHSLYPAAASVPIATTFAFTSFTLAGIVALWQMSWSWRKDWVLKSLAE